jgi:polar amino acid transport system substrate-binding protein
MRVRLLLLVLLALAPKGAVAQPAPDGPRRVLRVATVDAPPFALRQGNAWTGFAVELWQTVAQRMGVETRFVDMGERRGVTAEISAVREHQVDVAIAAIAVTPSRDAQVDFCVSYLDTGLQIAIDPNPDSGGLSDLLSSIPFGALGTLFLVAAGIMLALAHLIWLLERRHEPSFQRGYLRGIGEGLWVAALIIATGEYGERDTPRIVKRVTIAALWVLGVVLIAQFTATLTSNLTVTQLQANIAGPDDLPGKRIGSAPAGPSADWLRQRGLPFQTFDSPESALKMLQSGAAEALVYDAPTLRYYARLYGPDRMTVVGPIFQREQFAFAVAQGSPLRKQINSHLLSMIADGSYEAIYRRWFSDGG